VLSSTTSASFNEVKKISGGRLRPPAFSIITRFTMRGSIGTLGRFQRAQSRYCGLVVPWPTIHVKDQLQRLPLRTLFYETVCRWVNHFGPAIAVHERNRWPKPNTTWHLDEVCLEVDGRLVHLWRTLDTEGKMLGVLVRTRWDKWAVLKLALSQTSSSRMS
jgi:hypothetical protein